VIVLDANVLIAYLDGGDAHHEAAEALLVRASADTMAASPLTLAEVLLGPTRRGRLDVAQVVLRDLEIESPPLPAEAPARLAELRAGTGLKLPDCCVLLCAEDNAASLVTFDARLASVAEARGLTLLRG
jgi:predicted nucleic acid-binding protein